MADVLLVIGFVVSLWSIAYGVSLMQRLRWSERIREIKRYVHVVNNQKEGLR